MKPRNKKGSGVAVLILILFLAVIGTVVYFQFNSIEKSLAYGRPQKEIIETYAEMKAAKNYIRAAGKSAMQQAYYLVGYNGGQEKVECPPTKYLSCRELRKGEAVRTFSCPPDVKDNLCYKWNVYENCVPPCDIELNHNVSCWEPESGGGIICQRFNSTGGRLERFSCPSLNKGLCGDYGLELKNQELGTSLYGENITHESECDETPCGAYGTYAFWYNKGDKCLPDDRNVSEAFEALFEREFNKFLDLYIITEEDMVFDLEEQTLFDVAYFNISVSANKIIGKPLVREYEVPTSGGKETTSVKYEELMMIKRGETGIGDAVVESFFIKNQYFEVDVPYSIEDIIDKARGKANEVLGNIGSCSAGISGAAKQAAATVSKADENYYIEAEGKKASTGCIVTFDIVDETKKVSSADEKNGQHYGGIPVRFAVKYSGGAPSL